jgi:hydroxyacylglutathione hydrolase
LSDASDLYFAQIPVGEMANLAYLIGSRSTREVLLVDPAWNVDGLLEQAEDDGMKVVGALITHYHQDHVGGSIFGMNIEGVAKLLERAPVPIYVNEHEAEGTRRITGASASDLAPRSGGDVIELGGIRVRLLHTPGHTPGSQCFLVQNRLVAGDTLFLQGCGRTDFPGGDARQLYLSLTQKLAHVPDDAVLYPGHAYDPRPHQRLGDTRRSNPVFRPKSEAEWLAMFGG